jgi:N-acetylglucosaminyldiphosphoundecaprenol N-acetyl-beta-D-mannosaminyltransferase
MPRLLGLRIDSISADDIVRSIVEAATHKRRLVVINANAHMVLLARSRPWLRKLFDQADIAFCDGTGVQLAIWLKTGIWPHRSTPPQWMDAVGYKLSVRDAAIYWFGGRPEVVGTAAIRFSRKTGMRLSGWRDGFGDPLSPRVAVAINQAQPGVLVVCLGMPLQEQWIAENLRRITAPVVISAGALVDHAAGIRKRPPPWVANLGLEWLVRLVIEPRRLWRRYVLGLPVFAWLVFCEVLATRLGRFRG